MTTTTRRKRTPSSQKTKTETRFKTEEEAKIAYWERKIEVQDFYERVGFTFIVALATFSVLMMVLIGVFFGSGYYQYVIDHAVEKSLNKEIRGTM